MIPVCISRISSDSAHLNTAARWLNDEWGRDMGNTLGETLEWCIDLAEAQDEALYGAVIDDRLIGIATLVRSDLESQPHLTPWLSGLYVSPLHRGREVGAMLVRRVMAAARLLGHSRVYLFCPQGRLETYYAGLRWRRERPVSVDRRPYVVMSGALGQAAV